jgi:hypothetical protein
MHPTFNKGFLGKKIFASKHIALPVKFTTLFVRPIVRQGKSFLRLSKNEK